MTTRLTSPAARAAYATIVLLAAAGFTLATYGDGDARVPSGGTAGGIALLNYGAPVAVGNGRARAYVKVENGVPTEVGVALDEAALQGLPAPRTTPDPSGHHDMHEYLLTLPANNPTPYKFVELDWNPMGHEPDNVYTKPHFDFHFYKIPVAERNAIDPKVDAQYAAKAGNFPAGEFIRAGWVAGSVAAGAPAEVVAIPRMGMHWVNIKSPELPPTLQPFTKTFIVGTWGGRVIFDEPMITRDYILSKPNSTTPLAVAARHDPAGYSPAAYSVTYDPQSKEHRIALTQLAWRE